MISIGIENFLTKFNIYDLKKKPLEVDIEETQLNIIKTICDTLIANTILNGENLKSFPLRSRQEKDGHSHHFYLTESCNPSHRNQKIKGIQTRKEEVKFSLFAIDMTSYSESSKDYPKTVRINEFSKLQDTKLIYRNLLHFYTLLTNYHKEKLRKISFKNHIKKYLGLWSSHCGSVEMNRTSTHEDVDLTPGLSQWVKDSALL